MNHLVVQGSEIATRLLKELAGLCHASSIEQVNARSFRLHDIKAAAAELRNAAALCEAAQLDVALVPAGRKLAGMGLLVMDMDSTLISIECIDELTWRH